MCIRDSRCREAGRRASPPAEAFQATRTDYRAGGGEEVFLSFEDPTTDTVAGFLRLRFPAPDGTGRVRSTRPVPFPSRAHPFVNEVSFCSSVT